MTTENVLPWLLLAAVLLMAANALLLAMLVGGA